MIWLRELLYAVKFDIERLKVVATKMVNDVARMKRKGGTVVQAMINSLNFSNGSPHFLTEFVCGVVCYLRPITNDVLCRNVTCLGSFGFSAPAGMVDRP